LGQRCSAGREISGRATRIDIYICSAQPILLRAALGGGALGLVRQRDVEIARVLVVTLRNWSRIAGSARLAAPHIDADAPDNAVALADNQRLLEIENSLLPVRVLVLGAGGELELGMCLRELDREVPHDGVAVLVNGHVHLKI
jgi:hypothetical protein